MPTYKTHTLTARKNNKTNKVMFLHHSAGDITWPFMNCVHVPKLLIHTNIQIHCEYITTIF